MPCAPAAGLRAPAAQPRAVVILEKREQKRKDAEKRRSAPDRAERKKVQIEMISDQPVFKGRKKEDNLFPAFPCRGLCAVCPCGGPTGACGAATGGCDSRKKRAEEKRCREKEKCPR